jgi:carbon-monoxide dehydrogenase small subunit
MAHVLAERSLDFLHPVARAVGGPAVREAPTVEGASVETASGLDPTGAHPLQEAFMAGFAAQCGFCTPGMLMAAKALLDQNPRPGRAEVVEAIGGNICRCTGYEPIIDAILAASQRRSA